MGRETPGREGKWGVDIGCLRTRQVWEGLWWQGAEKGSQEAVGGGEGFWGLGRFGNFGTGRAIVPTACTLLNSLELTREPTAQHHYPQDPPNCQPSPSPPTGQSFTNDIQPSSSLGLSQHDFPECSKAILGGRWGWRGSEGLGRRERKRREKGLGNVST